MAKKVLVALDDSQESHNALEWALDHIVEKAPSVESDGIQREGDKVILIHAQPLEKISAAGPFGPGAFSAPEHLYAMRSYQDHVSHNILARAKEICTEHYVTDVETTVALGDARYVICDAVLELKPDLLVLGSHGHGVVKRALIGSVSDYCAHHAQTAVLVVKK